MFAVPGVVRDGNFLSRADSSECPFLSRTGTGGFRERPARTLHQDSRNFLDLRKRGSDGTVAVAQSNRLVACGVEQGVVARKAGVM